MKLIFKIAGVLLVVLLLAMAAVLIPAHLQVRSVEPELPSRETLEAVARADLGRGPISAQYVLTSRQTLERGEIAHVSVIFEWENGQKFLLDTGMDHLAAQDFAALLMKMDSSAGEVQVNGNIAELLGNTINSVAGVGFTHLHIDHTQGIEAFCNAKGDGAVLFQTQSQRELHNFNTSEGAELIAGSCLSPILLSSEGTDNGTGNIYRNDRFPGLAAIELGGHTPGSTLWMASIGSKVLLFSGDITNDKHSLDQDLPKDTLYSYLIVPEHTERTKAIRAWLRDLDQSDLFSVIVSHDLQSAKAHLEAFN